eukprot:15092888-Ditylum_brightwellii.AAC.1
MVDVINNDNPTTAATPFEWYVDLSTTIETVTNSALPTATEAPGLLPWLERLVTIFESLHGLGIYMPCQAAIAAFVIVVRTAICYTIKGIPFTTDA